MESVSLPPVTGRMSWKDGVGFFPAEPWEVYDRAYWEKYVGYRATPMGKALTDARLSMVRHFLKGPAVPLVDVGIGGGAFLDAAGPNVYGYDVNPFAIRWLLERGLWWDPWFRRAPHAALWDSLEHMERPDLFLERVDGLVFLSLPVFRDREHALASKHFRPLEHFWYFTRDGLVRWMGERGFGLLEESSHETDLGREDIGAFTFSRIRRP